MYCKSCGVEIEDDSKFCRRCGNEISGGISQTPGYVSDQSKKKISLVIAIAVALVIAAVAFLLFFTMDESPNSKVNNPSFYEELA